LLFLVNSKLGLGMELRGEERSIYKKATKKGFMNI
jgi:hypothetical protein